MNLNNKTRGDILGNISDKFNDMPEEVYTIIDEVLKLSGKSRREEGVLDALEFYKEALSKAKEGYVRIEIKIEELENLEMKGVPFYQLSFPGIDY